MVPSALGSDHTAYQAISRESNEIVRGLTRESVSGKNVAGYISPMHPLRKNGAAHLGKSEYFEHI